MLPITGHVLRVFHGKRLQCVQCHDHPFDGEGRQEQFYGINAMFRQVEFTQANGVETIKDNPALNLSGLALYERRNGVQMATDPTFLDGRKIPRNFKGTRRAFLAEQLVKHPNFSRAHVGFVWAFLFGRGLTETADFDDMGEHNPVVQEKIMDRLAKDFVKHGHDPKALLRWICNSDAYGLQSIANKTNAGDAAAVHFSRMQARPLTRRQLAESLAVVLTGGDYRKRRDALVAELLQEFTPLSFASASTHLAGCDIEPINGEGDITTRRALWLMNSKTLHREIAAGDGRVAKVLAKPGRTVNGVHAHALPELFTIALGRSPSAKEQSSFSPPSVFVSPSCRNLVVTPAIWQPHYEDLFWSLLNSSEFALNH
jgi:hypothetical protein